MKNLKFKRYKVGEAFNPLTAERDTFHIVPTSGSPLTVKIYDVDINGNVAEVKTDDWVENKQIVLNAVEQANEPATTELLGRVRMAELQVPSAAIDIATLVTDFNALILKLQGAGIMEAEPEI